jgi:hypothetical protein
MNGRQSLNPRVCKVIFLPRIAAVRPVLRLVGAVAAAVTTTTGRAGRIGDASFDKRAGKLDNLFNFHRPNDKQVLLAANGSVASVKHICLRSGWFWHGCR